MKKTKKATNKKKTKVVLPETRLGKQSKLENFHNLIIKTVFLLFIALSLTIFFSMIEKQSLFKRQLAFWKRITASHPEYPDGWAKLSIIWHNLGEEKLAKLAIGKARKLDPIREELKELEGKIRDIDI